MPTPVAASGLKVIALISGGKDSLYSILHCLAQGHSVVALANLHPPLQDVEDVDSYMYQTVGHSVIPLYEEALGLPLFRQPIKGIAADTRRDYHAPSATGQPDDGDDNGDDETEDLVPLLLRVKAAHPHANALSTGAILSNYQRTRVESVALRLGLVPLSYLWQYPSLPPYREAQLLRDMRAVRQEARIIKVASGGLDEGFLGLDVADERVVGRLVKSAERFGAVGDGAVLGEGGEFETLAVGGPRPLWRKRIVLEDEVPVRGEGGSATLAIGKAKVVEKEVRHGNGGEEAATPRIPGLLDDEFKQLLKDLETSAWVRSTGLYEHTDEQAQPSEKRGQRAAGINLHASHLWAQTRAGHTLYISNMACPGDTDAKDQMRQVAAELQSLLQAHDPPLTSSMITSTTLLLRSMSEFGTVNPVYGSLFTQPIPPARVTVSCGACMPVGVEVMMSVAIDVQPERLREGLHVQSRSYWAPANIGPYSQAVAMRCLPVASNGPVDGDQEQDVDGAKSEAQLVHIAGQIPLIPATMELAGSEDVNVTLDKANGSRLDVFFLQTVLSLQHLWRIGRVMGVQWWTGAVVFLPSGYSDAGGRGRAFAAMHAWRKIHQTFASQASTAYDNEDSEEAGEDVDVWDLRNRVSVQNASQPGANTPYRPMLPVFSEELVVVEQKGHPPVFAVQVEELPRGADIEWMSLGLTTTNLHLESNASRGPHTVRVDGTDTEVSMFALQSVKDLEVHLLGLPKEAHCTVFVSTNATKQRDMEFAAERAPSVVPCRHVWKEDGQEVAALAMARYVTESHR